jgi:hypothetical protein
MQDDPNYNYLSFLRRISSINRFLLQITKKEEKQISEMSKFFIYNKYNRNISPWIKEFNLLTSDVEHYKNIT